MTSESASRHEGTIIDVAEAEEFGALAGNWLEAEKAGDAAAQEAFENELHERITFDQIDRIQGLNAATGEPSTAETERLRGLLQRIWNNASVKRG
jgi:hypothetical protein